MGDGSSGMASAVQAGARRRSYSIVPIIIWALQSFPPSVLISRTRIWDLYYTLTMET